MYDIIIHGYEKVSKAEGWGDIAPYISSCILKAKLLGYSKFDMVFPRFTTQSFYDLDPNLTIYQDCGIKNIHVLPNNNIIDISKYKIEIDYSVDDSLYEGFKNISNNGIYYTIFNDLVYKEHNIIPVIPIERDKNNSNNYILFHIRNYYPEESLYKLSILDYNKYMKKVRNSNLSEVRYLLKLFKERYKNKFKYICIGDSSPVNILFDEWIKPNYNVKEFLHIIRNCKMIVGPLAGPIEFAYYFPDIPILKYSVIKMFDNYFDKLKINILDEKLLLRFGGRHPNWCDDRIYNIISGESLNKNDLLKFMDKYLED